MERSKFERLDMKLRAMINRAEAQNPGNLPALALPKVSYTRVSATVIRRRKVKADC
jgi:hypothetical protein